MFGSKAQKIRVHITPPGAVEVSLIWKEALEKEEDLHFNRLNQYTTAQREPAEEKKFSAAGRARAFLENMAKKVDSAGYARCSFQPEWRLTVGGPSGSACVGAIQPDASITWEEVGLKEAFGWSVKDVKTEFAAFRQA